MLALFTEWYELYDIVDTRDTCIVLRTLYCYNIPRYIVALIRYDTIRGTSLTWTRQLSKQLNLAHVAPETKTKPVPL